MTVGEQIKEARIKNKLTQEELAFKIKANPQNISVWEHNKRGIYLTTLQKIVNVLNTKIIIEPESDNI